MVFRRAGWPAVKGEVAVFGFFCRLPNFSENDPMTD
jgi:hypothetical protein